MLYLEKCSGAGGSRWRLFLAVISGEKRSESEAYQPVGLSVLLRRGMKPVRAGERISISGGGRPPGGVCVV